MRWIVGHPAILPCLLLAIQTIPSLWAKDVWFSDEVRHAAVLVQMIERGHWLVLHLGDTFYPDKPPLYFWVLAAISQVSGSTAPSVFMVAEINVANRAFILKYPDSEWLSNRQLICQNENIFA